MKEYEESTWHGREFDGGTIIELIHGYKALPQDILDMGRQFGQEPDGQTGSYITAIFRLTKGGTYKADLRWTPDAGYELMVFHSDENGHLKSGKDLYSARLGYMSVPGFMYHLKRFAGGDR